MPFKSKKQQSFLYSEKPEVAKEFERHTPKQAYHRLPEHVKKIREPFKAFSSKRKKNV